MNRINHQTTFIFDMDGTLVDNMACHNQVWVDILSEKGAQVDRATFNDRTAGKTNPEILRMFLGSRFSDEQLLAFSLEKETRYRTLYRQQIQPIPGLLDFLCAARETGIRLGLATSAGTENIAFTLDNLGITHYFQAIVNGEEIQRGKPDPEIFLEAAKRLGITPEEAIVFEDSPGGIEAGRRAGMPVVVITTGLTESQALQIPGVELAVKDFTQVQPIFQQQGILRQRRAA